MPLSVWQMEVQWALLQSPLKLSWLHLFKSFHFRRSQQPAEAFWEMLIQRGWLRLWLMGLQIGKTCYCSCDGKQEFRLSFLNPHDSCETLNASQLWSAMLRCSSGWAKVGARYKLLCWFTPWVSAGIPLDDLHKAKGPAVSFHLGKWHQQSINW